MKLLPHHTVLLVLMLLPAGVGAQGVAALDFTERYVEHFTGNEQGMDHSQVWSIEEGGDGFVFAATNEGLAMFDGVRWSIYPTVNDSPLRALYYDKITGTLYSAGVNMFGYWRMDPRGDMEYTSLFLNSREDSEDVWRICVGADPSILYFQTHTSLYRYRVGARAAERLDLPPGEIGFLFSVGGILYIQVGDVLYLLADDNSLTQKTRLQSRVVAILRSGKDIVLAVEHEGLFRLEGESLIPLNEATNRELSSAKINCCLPYLDGYLVGTTRKGLMVVDQSWELMAHHDDDDNDLLSRTVLSMTVDSHGDIWLGFNSGIAKVDISSNERYITDNQFGQIEHVLSTGDGLLVATNKGLFEAKEPYHDFRIVEGTLGATWHIAEIDDRVYVMHDRGLSEYSDGRLQLLYPGGVIGITRMRHDRNGYIASHYNGLSLYESTGDGLRPVGRIEGYNSYPQGLTVDNMDNLWTVVQGVGFHRLRLSPDKLTVVESREYAIPFDSRSSRKALCFAVINGEFILYGNSTAYVYDPAGDTLTVNDRVTALLSVCGPNLNCLQQVDNKLWYMSADDIGYVELVSGTTIKHSGIFGQSRSGRVTPAFFSIWDGVAVGFNNRLGFVRANNNTVGPVRIGKVEAFGTNRSMLYDKREGVFAMPFSMNNLRIYPVSLARGTMLDYRIPGVSDEWTTVKLNHEIWLSVLPPGRHTVEIRPSGLSDLSKYAYVTFHVARPWYISHFAIFMYAAAFVVAILLLRRHYRKVNRRQQSALKLRQREILEREKLFRDKQIAELQKEQIKIELREKDKRLVNITMNNIRRNNILNELKGEMLQLQGVTQPGGIRQGVQKIVRRINSELSDEDDWKRSESYFNTIYDGLLDRLKVKYPSLTKTDLKLCVYMKLNLSTKEMAELMNISPRSVEMARYRLRKKLDLGPGEPLEKVLLHSESAVSSG